MVAFWLIVCCGLCIACASSTGPEDPPPDPEPAARADTLWVLDTTISAGDTVGVYIYAVNSEPIGAYTIRLEYDSLVLGVPQGDTAFSPRQLRGSFEYFYAGLSTVGEIQIMAIAGLLHFYCLPIGAGNIVRLSFYVQDDIPAGTTTEISFVDADFDSNAYNWFADSLGITQFRPVRISGTITVGDAQGAARSIFRDSSSTLK